MNFFAEQERARRKTLLLVALMAAAVACLILMTAVAASLILYFTQQPMNSSHLAASVQVPWAEHFLQVLRSDILLYVGAAVLVVVLGGSVFKFLQLGGSGRRVADALGGRLLLANTQDAQERKILNVVEEMAIASGNPVPPVYLLEESSINAFAAGTDRRNAVIGITRGCMELLNRDELQGVIAHEFSHIHNGDMRLNLRLVAVLHGILLIGLIGSYLLRSSPSRSRNKNHGAVIGMGLAFVVLGYCGVFFGNIIKAAVSRQREFLADASAVQFTRNPAGITNALRKIGGHAEHALLQGARAAEFSHMYFGQGIESFFGGIMATHPPVSLRIRKIQPRWDGTMITPAAVPSEDRAQPARPTPAAATAPAAMAIAAAVAQVGNPTAETLAVAQVFLQDLPKAIYDAAHDPFSCRALIYLLLMDRDDSACQERQRQLLRQSLDQQTFAALEALDPEVQKVGRAEFLRIVDLAAPALKGLSQNQYQLFKKSLIVLIRADEKISLLEWCLYRIVTSNYEGKVVSGHKRLAELGEAVQILLIALCEGQSDVQFASGIAAAERHLPGVSLQKEVNRSLSIPALDAAIKQLEQLRPLEKPLLLKALAGCIESDESISETEVELFRAVADCLNCPVPPMAVRK